MKLRVTFVSKIRKWGIVAKSIDIIRLKTLRLAEYNPAVRTLVFNLRKAKKHTKTHHCFELFLPRAARCSEPWHAPRAIFKAFYPNKKWNRSLRSRWNNLLCKLWNLMLRIKWMWNKSSPPQRFHTPQAYFTFTEQIFHIEDISLVPTEQISLKKAFAILCKNTAYSFYNV